MAFQLLCGIRQFPDQAEEQLKTKLSERIGDSVNLIKREVKKGILFEVQNNLAQTSDRVALLLDRHVDATPFNISELIQIRKYLPTANIVILYDRVDAQDVSFLGELYNNGFYCALDKKQTKPSTLVDLFLNGRTNVEAHEVYELSDNTILDTMSFEEAYIVLTQPVDNEQDYVERLNGMKKRRMPEPELHELINKLDDNIKDFLCSTEYVDYLTDYLKRKIERQRAEAERNKERELSLRSMAEVNQVQSYIKKNIIGVAGTDRKSGSTHMSLSIAHYLARNGYRVALLEYKEQEHYSFRTISEERNIKEKKGTFPFQGVDYYPEFDLKQLPYLNTLDYNFYVVDFGMITAEKKEEFMGSLMSIIVTGSQDWDKEKLRKVFPLFEGNLFKLFYIVFNFAPDSSKKKIMEAMRPLTRIYFSDCMPNPFSGGGNEAITDIFDLYVKAPIVGNLGERTSIGVLNKVKKTVGDFFK